MSMTPALESGCMPVFFNEGSLLGCPRSYWKHKIRAAVKALISASLLRTWMSKRPEQSATSCFVISGHYFGYFQSLGSLVPHTQTQRLHVSLRHMNRPRSYDKVHNPFNAHVSVIELHGAFGQGRSLLLLVGTAAQKRTSASV